MTTWSGQATCPHPAAWQTLRGLRTESQVQQRRLGRELRALADRARSIGSLMDTGSVQAGDLQLLVDESDLVLTEAADLAAEQTDNDTIRSRQQESVRDALQQLADRLLDDRGSWM